MFLAFKKKRFTIERHQMAQAGDPAGGGRSQLPPQIYPLKEEEPV